MTLPATVWEQVRRRAGCACEYCGISETDAGGLLTVDHYCPRSQGGSDDLDNLIYCCFRCNHYKHDYWDQPEASLWNPRRETAEAHFLLLDDGSWHPLSATGERTLNLLRLNRPALITHRSRQLRHKERAVRAARLKEIFSIIEQLRTDRIELAEEHQALLQEQRELLELLLED